LARFVAEVDPDLQLPELERERRAAAARRLYFSRLAFRSSKARSDNAPSKTMTPTMPMADVIRPTSIHLIEESLPCIVTMPAVHERERAASQ
jgi:hypothetical protein